MSFYCLNRNKLKIILIISFSFNKQKKCVQMVFNTIRKIAGKIVENASSSRRHAKQNSHILCGI